MVHPKILKFEDMIRDRSIRICGVFSENGQKLIEKEENSSWNFPFIDEELEMMQHKILTYNDAMGDLPSNLFSKNVIKLAIDVQLTELRVATKSGAYSLKPTSGIWPEYDTIYDTFRETREYMDSISFETEYREAVTTEGLDFHFDYHWYVQHYIWGIVARCLGLAYQRYPLSSPSGD